MSSSSLHDIGDSLKYSAIEYPFASSSCARSAIGGVVYNSAFNALVLRGRFASRAKNSAVRLSSDSSIALLYFLLFLLSMILVFTHNDVVALQCFQYQDLLWSATSCILSRIHF